MFHTAARALAASLMVAAFAAFAAPSARADDPRSAPSETLTGGVRAPDRFARGASRLTPQATSAPTRDTATVVQVIPAGGGFDWTSAGIGAGGGIALVLIAFAGAAAVTNHSRPARR